MKSQPTGVITFASRTRPSTDQNLQKSFHLSHPDKIELKKIPSPSENKKYATTQTDTTQTMTTKLNTDNGLQGQTDRTPAGNKGFANMAGTVGKSTVVHLINFGAVGQVCAFNPPHRKAPNR